MDRAAEALTTGIVELAHSRPDSALHFASRAVGYPQEALLLSLRGDAYRALGQRDSAKAMLRRILAADSYGAEGQEEWHRAHILLGDLLLAEGDTAGARQAYQALVQRWREAPSALPDLVAARARLVALGGTSDR